MWCPVTNAEDLGGLLGCSPSSWAVSASGMGLAAVVAMRPKIVTRAVSFMLSVLGWWVG